METLYVHEAVPATTSRSRSPRSRRICLSFGAIRDFTPPTSRDGRTTPSAWRDEMGVYSTPHDRARAARGRGVARGRAWWLTRGCTRHGWSGQQAIDYFVRNAPKRPERDRERDRPLHRVARPGAGLQDRRAHDLGDRASVRGVGWATASASTPSTTSSSATAHSPSRSSRTSCGSGTAAERESAGTRGRRHRFGGQTGSTGRRPASRRMRLRSRATARQKSAAAKSGRLPSVARGFISPGSVARS